MAKHYERALTFSKNYGNLAVRDIRDNFARFAQSQCRPISLHLWRFSWLCTAAMRPLWFVL
jgi:hypothetical protein